MRKSEKDFLRAYDAAAEGIEVEKDERTPFWNPRRIGLAAGAAREADTHEPTAASARS